MDSDSSRPTLIYDTCTVEISGSTSSSISLSSSNTIVSSANSSSIPLSYSSERIQFLLKNEKDRYDIVPNNASSTLFFIHSFVNDLVVLLSSRG